MSARPAIRYVMTEKASGERAFDELIVTSSTVTRADTCCFEGQLRLAIERSLKANIAEFITRLLEHKRP